MGEFFKRRTHWSQASASLRATRTILGEAEGFRPCLRLNSSVCLGLEGGFAFLNPSSAQGAVNWLQSCTQGIVKMRRAGGKAEERPLLRDGMVW